MSQVELLASLVSKREKYFARIQTLYEVGKKCILGLETGQPHALELDSFISRFNRLEDDLSEFERINDKITSVNLKVDEKDRVEVNQPSVAYDELYFSIQTQARKLKVQIQPTKEIQAVSEASSQSGHVESQSAKLPKIEIEPYDGLKISEWPNFYALFTSLIHKNKLLSKVEKLTYLRSLLKNHALSLIETLAISNENYDIAMETLIKRFQNKRLLASNYLDKIFSFRTLYEESSKSLNSFLEIFSTNLNALKALQVPDLFDFTILYAGLRALSPTARKEFEVKYSEIDIPNCKHLIHFVEERIKVFELTHSNTKTVSPPIGKPNLTGTKFNKPIMSVPRSSFLSTTSQQTTGATSNTDCPICHLSHKIFTCDKFKELNVTQRYELVKKLALCFNCLGFHRLHACRSQSKCIHCRSRRHHSLLHVMYNNKNDSASGPSQNCVTSAPTEVDSVLVTAEPTTTLQSLSCAVNQNIATDNYSVMLSTALIGMCDADGQTFPIRAVIDSGSQVSLITNACVQKLRLVRYRNHIALNGVSNITVNNNRGFVSCEIMPLSKSNIRLHTNALIVDQICSDQPNIHIDVDLRKRFSGIALADPNFDKQGPVEFLLGAELYSDILQESCNIIKGEPSAISTIFGWMLSGKVSPQLNPNVNNPTLNKTSLFLCCESLDIALRKFWETEEVNRPIPDDPENAIVESHFIKNFTRDTSGRYTVCLPFVEEDPILPCTRIHAKTRLINLERRLQRQPPLYKEYRNFMNQYLTLGHMTLASSKSDYIIPHHCVEKLDSSSTKVRTVFDASFRPSSNSKSLNDFLLPGPKLQHDITDIICNFRLNAIVVCCDVQQMYRQILICKEQRKFQHIYYRTEQDGDIEEYELNTITFGVTTAPYLAQRVLHQLVIDEGHKYPLASKAILQQTFVDDICESVETVQEALQLQAELIKIFTLGGFNLRKWISNHQAVLDGVPIEHREHALILNQSEDHSLKILGVQYDPQTDCFSYCITSNPIVFTKRSMLSEIAKFYDPLGWVTPITFYAKCLIQKVWLMGLSWDEPLPTKLQEEWTHFVNDLPLLAQIKIPRHIKFKLALSRQIIGFCDGSSKGYGAVIYIRCEFADEIKVYLLKAKGRVAPLKTLSIPRLELSAAVLLSRLFKSIECFMKQIEPVSVHLFTDSSVVLAWLHTPPHTLKTFVANRTVEVLENTLPTYWHHVPTKENPSDCASRGVQPRILRQHALWWKGPSFLYTPSSSWTYISRIPLPNSALPDLKVDALISTTIERNFLLECINKSSSLSKLLRIIAFILRFCYNARCIKQGVPKQIGPLTPSELQNTMYRCIKEVQRFYYDKEIYNVKAQKLCAVSLQKLSPFLDDRDLLRVGGRLINTELSYDAKHPLLIPRESHLALLICDYTHKLTLHGGARLMQSLIQRQYWIVGIRQLLRQRIFKCTRCYRLKAQTFEPKMANLPKSRVRQSRPFWNTGVDFAGPWTLRESRRRKAPQFKAYLAIFVCLATKAIHLELVSDLSTASFLAALDRFIARRGLCSEIFCDCGSNFKGANHYFKDVCKILRDSNAAIADHLSNCQIKWNFNPPSAPHFGGLWEAAVKSAKHHLQRSLHSLILTFEEMTTVLARVEAILNSRPLGSISIGPLDHTDYLTPGHFLIGAPFLAPPELDVETIQLNNVDSYHLLQRVTQSFWRRWSTEYLQTLVPRGKWLVNHPNVKVGDIVILKEREKSPLLWPLGKIQEIYPGQDGIVRVAKVRTHTGVYVRPLCKMAALPLLES